MILMVPFERHKRQWLTDDGQENGVLKGRPLDEEHCEPDDDHYNDVDIMLMMIDYNDYDNYRAMMTIGGTFADSWCR